MFFYSSEVDPIVLNMPDSNCKYIRGQRDDQPFGSRDAPVCLYHNGRAADSDNARVSSALFLSSPLPSCDLVSASFTATDYYARFQSVL